MTVSVWALAIENVKGVISSVRNYIFTFKISNAVIKFSLLSPILMGQAIYLLPAIAVAS